MGSDRTADGPQREAEVMPGAAAGHLERGEEASARPAFDSPAGPHCVRHYFSSNY